jgi:hypothetical protein
MANVEVITNVIYYSIQNDLTFHESSSFAEAAGSRNLKFILQKNTGYNPFETNSGSVIKNYAADMNLLNSDNTKLISIEENNWKMELSSFGLTAGYAYTTMWVTYTDSFGYSATETFGISVDGFTEAYKRFQRLNKVEGYKFAVLSIKNEDLIAENNKLSEKVAQLTQEK